jgi:2,4-dienoyl-CoA reductase-like NADH-dependent reductase (Old Yellow Enzyme family)
MNEALATGATDMIGLARPLAVDPTLSNKLLADSNYAIQLPGDWPEQYLT